MEMLVTQALNELKLLDSRIEKAILESNFITSSKNSEKNAAPGLTKEDFNKKAKASYDKVIDLIERREKIKAAVIKSNAETFVEIAGETMTVAKAIDTKESIEHKKTLLFIMKDQYDKALVNVNKKNEKVEEKINAMCLSAVGKDSKDKIDAGMYDAIAKPIRAAEEYGLVDPLQISDKIEELSEYIENFSSEVDAKLQVSNCITTITI